MEKKTLEKMLSYLPIIQSTCDRFGWDGMRAAPVEKSAIVDGRRFWEYLQTHIPLKDIPELEDVHGNCLGAITFLWETELDPVKVSYDTFQIDVQGNNTISYRANLESLNTKVWEEIPLETELCQDIIEHIKFFQRRKNEQKIQESTTLKRSTNK